MKCGRVHKTVSKSQSIPHSPEKFSHTHIPHLSSPVFAYYPLISCQTDGINEDFFVFTDPSRPYKCYGRSVDVTKVL